MKRVVVVTGITGSFGQLLLPKLFDTDTLLVCLVRAESLPVAEKIVTKNFSLKERQHIEIIAADLLNTDLGISSNKFQELIKKSTHILHAAATTHFTNPLNVARTINVGSTKQLISFAKKCNKLEKFGFVSTAYVAGKRIGRILEHEFDDTAGFLNSYEQTKYESELLVRNEKNELPIQIFRPSLVITKLEKKVLKPVNAVSFGLFLARKGMLPILPGTAESRLDLIAGSTAADAISAIFFNEKFIYDTHHISTANAAYTVSELLNLFEIDKSKITFAGNIENFQSLLAQQFKYRPDLQLIYKKVSSFLPELAYSKIFDFCRTKEVLPDFNALEDREDQLRQIF